MGFWRKHRPQTFDVWLDQATRGLCDFAKTQVREEYEDHFTAAYEQLRAEGLDRSEAKGVAVQSLGKAREVRKQLQRVFLTRKEDKWLSRNAAWNIQFKRYASQFSRAQKVAAFFTWGVFFC